MSVRQIVIRMSEKVSSRRPLAGLLAVALVASGAVAASARAWLAPSSPQEVGEVRTTLGQNGFEPTRVTRGEGRFRLTVANSSGREGLTFRLVRTGGTQIYQGQMAAGAAEWSREFDLTAGTYVLSVVDDPASLFYVIVQ